MPGRFINARAAPPVHWRFGSSSLAEDKALNLDAALLRSNDNADEGQGQQLLDRHFPGASARLIRPPFPYRASARAHGATLPCRRGWPGNRRDKVGTLFLPVGKPQVVRQAVETAWISASIKRAFIEFLVPAESSSSLFSPRTALTISRPQNREPNAPNLRGIRTRSCGRG